MGRSARLVGCGVALLLAVCFPGLAGAGGGSRDARVTRMAHDKRSDYLHAYMVSMRCPSQWASVKQIIHNAPMSVAGQRGPRNAVAEQTHALAAPKTSLLNYRLESRIQALLKTETVCHEAVDDKGMEVYLPLNLEANPAIAARDGMILGQKSQAIQDNADNVLCEDTDPPSPGPCVSVGTITRHEAVTYLALEMIENRCPSRVGAFIDTLGDLAILRLDTSGKSLVDMMFSTVKQMVPDFTGSAKGRRKLLGRIHAQIPVVGAVDTIFDYRYLMCTSASKLVETACADALDDFGTGVNMVWIQGLGCDGMDNLVAKAAREGVVPEDTTTTALPTIATLTAQQATQGGFPLTMEQQAAVMAG